MYTVVLVDDEEVIVNGLKKIIDWEKYNCEVVGVAYDAAMGAKVIQEHKPNILFTDINMPDQSGLHMLAGLRSEFPKMQVTVLSGYNDFSYAQEAMRLGVCRYLLKPSKVSEINEVLEEMTKRLAELTGSKDLNMNENEQVSNSGKSSLDDVNSFIVRTAVDYIKENYQNKLTLVEVAEESHVSQWHLSKLLNKHLSKNFYDVLNEVRITNAKKLLGDASLRISDISYMVGYADSTHFSRIFKKEVGVSANAYRASLHKQKYT
ncbi:MAG: response regulator [Eubacteriales bacterium]